MTRPTIVSDQDWLEARRELLAKEKEFTRLRDELTAARQQMPWRRVDQNYRFQTTSGDKTLGELFDGRSQLITYHFMFGSDWQEGCPICSMFADNYGRMDLHLAQRDVTMVTVSLAPLARLQAYRERMNWDFEWVSSEGSDFNRDFHVTFTEEEVASGKAFYNFRAGHRMAGESPGISVFARNDAGEIFHTYSAYSRGLESLMGIYRLLDIVPRGRDEDELPWPMAWLKRRDTYQT
jgi:predicted dithiol-disulfide oxidoreductase (DUF899 family)